MRSKLGLALATCAGFTGGLAAQWFAPLTSHAQERPAVIEARSFALVDDTGKVMGTFRASKSSLDGSPEITLESQGNVIWRVPEVHFSAPSEVVTDSKHAKIVPVGK